MKAVDLFCGCGGMSLGFENAGVEILAAYDNWAPAISIYKNNFNHPVHDLDLNSEEAIDHIKAYAEDRGLRNLNGCPIEQANLAEK